MTDAPPAVRPAAVVEERDGPPALRGTVPQLETERIIATVAALRDRIEERFPGSGLGRIAEQLLHIAEVTAARVVWVQRPLVWLRVVAWVVALWVVALVLLAVVYGLRVQPSTGSISVVDFLQALEAGLNDVVLIGAAIWFLVTVEGRIKRRRALGFLRELRALAHIVDMHQLTKDPDTLVQEGPSTASSPHRTMTRYELSRYLDYCSEMLALNSKLAALYAQNLDDPVVLAAVDEVEMLTGGLSNKVWHKLVVLNQPASPVG